MKYLCFEKVVMVGMRSTRVPKPFPTLDLEPWTSDHTDFIPIFCAIFADDSADAYGRLGGRVRTDNPSVKCGYGRVDGSGRVVGVVEVVGGLAGVGGVSSKFKIPPATPNYS